MKLFLTTAQAAEMVGLHPRHFVRKYVDTGRLRRLIFRKGNGKAKAARYMRAEVEKLKS